MENQYYLTAILRAFAIAGQAQSHQQTSQTPAQRGSLSTNSGSLFLIQTPKGPTHRRNSSWSKAVFLSHAKRFAGNREIHFTPTHGSWINLAEIEIRVISRQYFFEDR